MTYFSYIEININMQYTDFTMKKSIYDYTHYKPFLLDLIRSRPYNGRGVKAALAKSLRIHTAYISQVLNKDAHFTLEQAEELTELLSLTQNESHFFLLLVQRERAGSFRLKKYFEKQIDKFKEAQKQLKNRLEIEHEIKPEDQQRYYSSWHYIAIHALISIPEYQKKEVIQKRLNIPIEKVNEVIEFLLRVGLINRVGDNFVMGSRDLHLSSTSPMISKHHSNWRMRGIDALDRLSDDDLHYSGVISVKKEDAMAIKNILIKSLQEVREVIKKSDVEEVYCYTIDLFSI